MAHIYPSQCGATVAGVTSTRTVSRAATPGEPAVLELAEIPLGDLAANQLPESKVSGLLSQWVTEYPPIYWDSEWSGAR